MRVMITGGTGFVGLHATRALLAAGHEVTLLVRSIDKLLDLYGEDGVVDYVRGDILDKDSVQDAVEDCAAVVHAAAMVSVDPRDAERVYRGNVQGTQNVIDAAMEAAVEAVVHVSSVTALFDPAASVLDENSPPGTARNAYGRSKVECERYARRLQDAGAPVYIVYPASVIGPDDPGLTEPHQGLQAFLTSGLLPRLPTGNQWVDVRDIAAIIARLLEQRPAQRRFTAGGHYLPWPELGRTLQAVTGRRFITPPVPGGLMRLAGNVLDLARKAVPIELPISEESMDYATRWVPMSNDLVEQALDISFCPVQDSLRAAIRWLHAAGHITARQAGAALEDA